MVIKIFATVKTRISYNNSYTDSYKGKKKVTDKKKFLKWWNDKIDELGGFGRMTYSDWVRLRREAVDYIIELYKMGTPR